MTEKNVKKVNLLKELSSNLTDFRERFPILTLAKGTLIMKPDNIKNKLYLIKSGEIQIYKITSEGKQCTLSVLLKGDIFGETQLLSFGPREIYATTLSISNLYQIEGRTFYEILENNPKIALKVLEWTNLRLKDTEELLEKIAYGDAKTRLLYQLIRLCDNFGIYKEDYCKLAIRLTHQDLANMVAVSRETVTHTLNQLAKKGILKTEDHIFLIKCQEVRKLLLNNSTFGAAGQGRIV